MAEKRMFTKKITQSDEFLSMPHSSQNLYWHLNTEADDEGFVNSPKRVLRMIGANEDDMKILLAKRFLIGFESGVIVIKHWKMHNVIRTERLKPTSYVSEKQRLSVKEDGSYTLNKGNGVQLSDKCQPNVRIEEIRLEENRLEEISIEKHPTLGEFNNVKLSEDEYKKITELGLLDYIERLSAYIAQTGKRYKSHYATILNWSRKDSTPKKSGRVELQTEYKTVETSLDDNDITELSKRFAELGGI